MSEDARIVREAVLDTSNALVPGTMSEKSHSALTALARLEARLAEQEREIALTRSMRDRAFNDAEAAEARVVQLEASDRIAKSVAGFYEPRIEELEGAITEAMASLGTGPAKDGYAYSVLDAATDEAEGEAYRGPILQRAIEVKQAANGEDAKATEGKAN